VWRQVVNYVQARTRVWQSREGQKVASVCVYVCECVNIPMSQIREGQKVANVSTSVRTTDFSENN